MRLEDHKTLALRFAFVSASVSGSVRIMLRMIIYLMESGNNKLVNNNQWA